MILKMKAEDLPKTREEITLWALKYSQGLNWRDLDETLHIGIVAATQIILNWVCVDIAKHFPDLIKIEFLNQTTTRIHVAGVKVAGGSVPGAIVINYLEKHSIDVEIVGHSYLSRIEMKNFSHAHLGQIKIDDNEPNE